MKSEINIEYRGKNIYYNQDKDEWSCEDFAHHRGSPTLTLAKARIDKILEGPTDKPKPFEKVQVWAACFGFGRGDWKLITLTSKTEDGFWATHGGQRSKISESDSKFGLKINSPKNTELVNQIKAKHEQISSLRKEIDKIEQSLEAFKA